PGFSARQRFGTPVLFLPDGKFALTDDPRLYELASGRSVREIEDRHGGIHSIALSLDGKLALSAHKDGTVMLWNVATGKEEKTFVGHQGEVLCVAFSPTGSARFPAAGMA